MQLRGGERPWRLLPRVGVPVFGRSRAFRLLEGIPKIGGLGGAGEGGDVLEGDAGVRQQTADFAVAPASPFCGRGVSENGLKSHFQTTFRGTTIMRELFSSARAEKIGNHVGDRLVDDGIGILEERRGFANNNA